MTKFRLRWQHWMAILLQFTYIFCTSITPTRHLIRAAKFITSQLCREKQWSSCYTSLAMRCHTQFLSLLLIPLYSTAANLYWPCSVNIAVWHSVTITTSLYSTTAHHYCPNRGRQWAIATKVNGCIPQKQAIFSWATLTCMSCSEQ
jgi:hypothetical protein